METLLLLKGLPESPIENVRLVETTLRSARGIVANHVRGLRLTDVKTGASRGPALTLRETRDAVFRGFRLEQAGTPWLVVSGAGSEAIRFDSSFAERQSGIRWEPGARFEAVIFDDREPKP